MDGTSLRLNASVLVFTLPFERQSQRRHKSTAAAHAGMPPHQRLRPQRRNPINTGMVSVSSSRHAVTVAVSHSAPPDGAAPAVASARRLFGAGGGGGRSPQDWVRRHGAGLRPGADGYQTTSRRRTNARCRGSNSRAGPETHRPQTHSVGVPAGPASGVQSGVSKIYRLRSNVCPFVCFPLHAG